MIIILNDWFKEREIGLACAMMVTIAKIGVSSTNLVTPQILVISESLTTALSLGTILQLISLLMMVAFTRIDLRNE